MSEGYLEPVVATATFDVAPFLEGAKRAVGATSDLTGSLDRAGIAAAKTEVAISQAALKAAASQDKAAAAAARAGKAETDAAAAAEKAAAGEITMSEASDKAATAQDLAAKAARAQAQASLDARTAVLAQAAADEKLAASAGVATKAQADTAAASVGLAAKSGAAATEVASKAGVLGRAATTVKDNWVLAAAVIGVESVHLAGTFEQQTNVLVTAAGESAKNLGLVRDGILNIATSTGTSWQQVTSAVYVAEKAGYRGAQALQVVKASAQGAREENANLATVLNATTSVMASYGLKSSDAVRVTNEIKTAAGEAKTTMEAFAGSLSTVLPIASANHISFADVAGDLATLTQHGTSADEASQELANTIRNLSGSNAVASKEMAQFDISSVDVAQHLGTRGLTGTIDYLTQTILGKLGPSGLVLLNTFNQSKIAAADAQQEYDNLSPAVQKLATQFENGSISAYAFKKDLRDVGGEQSVLGQQFLTTYTNAKGFQQALRNGTPAAQAYTQALKAIFGGANGLNVALQLTGSQAAATNERVQKIAASAKGAGKDVSGWASTQKQFNVQLDEFKQRAAAVGIHLGEDLIPPLESILKLINAHPQALKLAAEGVAGLGAAWLGLKFVSWIGSIGTMTTRLFGLSKAADVAAASTRGLAGAEAAAGAAGAAEGAGAAAGAAGAGVGAAEGAAAGGVFSRIGAKYPLLKIAVPVAVTLGTIKVLGLQKAADDLVHGQIGPAIEHSPGWITAISGGVGHGLKTLGIGGKDQFTGGLSGTATGKLALAPGYAEQLRFVQADKAIIDDFNKTLAITGNLVDSNSKSLTGNSAAAQLNRAAIGLLVQKAKDGADAEYRLTGKQSDYNAALRLAVPAIENAATALGFNKQQVDDLIRSLGLIPATKTTKVTLPGADQAQLSLLTILDTLSRIPAQKQVDISVIQTGSAPAALIAQAATSGQHGLGAGRQATGGPIVGPGTGTSDSVPILASNGEFIVRAAAVKKYGVGFMHAVNAGKFAKGGLVETPDEKALKYISEHKKVAAYLAAINARNALANAGGASGFLHDIATLGDYTKAQQTILAYNTANIGKATAAQIPGLERAVFTSQEVAKATLAYFNAHKAGLVNAIHTGTPAQRKAATAVYHTLQTDATTAAAAFRQESALADQLRRRWAGQESSPLSFGRPTRDLSYLAVTGAPTVQGPSHINLSVVSVLDGREIGRNVTQYQLRTERRGLTSGNTAVRNPAPSGSR